MVGSSGAGKMPPMLLITPGQTQDSCKKLVNENPQFSMCDGGWKENGSNMKRHVLKGGKWGTDLAIKPPHYYDPDTGHILVAGTSHHRHTVAENLETLATFIRSVSMQEKTAIG